MKMPIVDVKEASKDMRVVSIVLEIALFITPERVLIMSHVDPSRVFSCHSVAVRAGIIDIEQFKQSDNGCPVGVVDDAVEDGNKIKAVSL